MPDTNTRWVLGTLAVLAGLILQQGAATNARIDDLRADMQAGFARIDDSEQLYFTPDDKEKGESS